MKRTIIHIDEEKCNGCGLCITNCPEGALKLVNGKARVVKESLCDGLGACIGHCPQGAITIEERTAETYDETTVMETISRQGEEAIRAHLAHLKAHGQKEHLDKAVRFLKEEPHTHPQSLSGCPGSMARELKKDAPSAAQNVPGSATSELRQWPIQLHMVNPQAPHFNNAELLIAADCVPFAFSDFHRRFLKNKTVIILCPKLDNAREEYIKKLAEIFKYHAVKSITITHMEVPCCFGVTSIVEEALKASGKNVFVKEFTVSLQGEIV